HRSLPGLSRKMLTQTLREMEGSGLVHRHAHATVPPAVEYRLTPLGRRFLGLVELVHDWGRANADALDQLGHRPTSKRNLSPPAHPDRPGSASGTDPG
ncbi:MAG: helix-turn-helix transcriptional regulator, partial [Gluconacetobacter diazotrophicus]|nr:helix-turn-helix transcriptional regulator [Gluconacetobacter diazotrophicus]